MKDWEVVADNLIKPVGWVSAIEYMAVSTSTI